MRPERGGDGIVDLLDRLLDKGLLLNADIVITVAGIPLLGVSLNAALAGMETMLHHGMLEDWDRSTRAWHLSQARIEPPLQGGEILFSGLGSIWHGRGTLQVWKPGIWYVTEKELLLWSREPASVIFQSDLSMIRGLIGGNEEVSLILDGGAERIRMDRPEQFCQTLAEALALPAG